MLETVRQELAREFSQFNESDQELLTRALTLAEQIHAGQFRKPRPETPDQRDPYIIHPMRVTLILIREAGVRDAKVLAAGLLHDVVEDSDGRVTADNLQEMFGNETAGIVATLSKPPYLDGVSRHEQLSVYHQGVNNAPIDTRLVKLADRLDNIRDALLTSDRKFQEKYLPETREIYLPLAAATSQYFYNEIAAACDKLAVLLNQQK